MRSWLNRQGNRSHHGFQLQERIQNLRPLLRGPLPDATVALDGARDELIDYEQRRAKECETQAATDLPAVVRRRAAAIPKHYPDQFDVERLCARAPDIVSRKF